MVRGQSETENPAVDDTLATGEPIAWTAICEHSPVFASNGDQVGIVAEVLGTEDGGIFHGLAVRHHRLEHAVEVPAASVGEITDDRVTLTITTQAFEDLPPYEEEKAFRLGMKGLFRHRPGWVRDRS